MPGRADGQRPPEFDGLDHVSLPCRNLQGGIRFYRDVLGGELVAETPAFAFFELWGTRIGIGSEGCTFLDADNEYPHLGITCNAEALVQMKSVAHRVRYPIQQLLDAERCGGDDVLLRSVGQCHRAILPRGLRRRSQPTERTTSGTRNCDRHKCDQILRLASPCGLTKTNLCAEAAMGEETTHIAVGRNREPKPLSLIRRCCDAAKPTPEKPTFGRMPPVIPKVRYPSLGAHADSRFRPPQCRRSSDLGVSPDGP